MIDETDKIIDVVALKKEEPVSPTPEVNLPVALADTEKLQQQATHILNELIAETDIAKTNDLLYLFNINQSKKTTVRIDAMGRLLDTLAGEAYNRATQKPDELSNDDLVKLMKVAADLIDKGQTQIKKQEEAPLIQINTQNNDINMAEQKGLDRLSRDKVKKAIMDLLKGIAAGDTQSVEDIIDASIKPGDTTNEQD